MVKEGKFVINHDTGETVDIKQSDFEFVQMDKKIHDVKFSAKATTFFKDAMRRFAKSKSALAGGIIVGLLILLAIIVPSVMPNNGAFNVARDSAGGNVAERYIQPKLLPAGTGFWDGTIKKTHILYDVNNKVPNGYREGTFFNLQTYEEYVNQAAQLGRGGYVNIFANDSKNIGNMFSSYYTFDLSSNDYSLEFNLLKEEVSGYISSSYRVLLESENGDRYYLTNSDGSFIDSLNYSVNINEVLTNNGYTDLLSNEEGSSLRVRIEVEPKTGGYGNILMENLTLSSSNNSENEALKVLSFDDANELLLRERGSDGYWNSTSGKNAYKIHFTYCDFTFDQYESVYGKQDYTYSPAVLNSMENSKQLQMNFSGDVVKATSDPEILKERFVVLSDDCPIVEVIEQVGDATYNPRTRNYDGYTLKVKVLGYKLYGYSSMPLFLFGTNTNCKDYFKLIFTGLRFSFLLAIGVSAVNIAFGLVWGSISGYFGGWTDILMERFCEILSGIPSTVVITLCILYGSELQWGDMSDVLALMIALFVTGWMGVSGRTRTQFYRFKGREYVLASRTLGAKDSRLIFRHILPNSLGTIITGSILMIPSVIYTEASIAYLGLGLSGQVMFGVILSEANSYYTGENTFLLVIPTILMAFLLVSFNMFGNGLRDAFNPQLKGSE